MQNSNKNVLGSVIWTVVRVWGNRLFGFFIFLVLARVLDPEMFGVYAAMWSVLLLLEVFAEQGLSDALIQKKDVDQTLINSVFLINMVFAVFLTIAVCILAPYIGQVMNMPAMVLPLQISAISLTINGLGYIQIAMCRRLFLYKFLAARTLISTIVSGSLGIVLALAGYGVWSLVAQFLTNSLLNSIILWIKPAWKPTARYTWQGGADLVRYSLKLFGSRLLEAINTRGFELAIGAWLGSISLGIFTIASRVQGIMMQMLGNVIMDVAHTSFSRLAHDDKRFIDAYYMSMSASAFVSIPIFLMISALAHPICSTVFGPQWAASGDTLELLSLLSTLLCIQYLNSSAINAKGHPVSTLIVSLFKTLAVLASLFLYGQTTLYHLITAYCIGQALALPLNLALGKYYLKFNWLKLFKSIISYLIGGVLLYFVAKMVFFSLDNYDPWFSLIIASISGIISYAAIVYILARKQLLTTLKSIKGK